MNSELTQRFPGISFSYRDREMRIGHEYAGLANKQREEVVDENTIFPACSISKFVTAVCVMKLKAEGVLHLDKDVNTYLLRWKVRTKEGVEVKVTLRNLLSHTGGICDGEDGFYGHRLKDGRIELLDILEGKTKYNNRPSRVENEPGTVFEYSDAGYCIIQQLIEDVTGKGFEKIAEQLIFDPLGMRNSFFGTPENLVHLRKEKKLATGYLGNGDSIEDDFPICPDLSASALWSTSTDLMILADDFMNSIVDGYAKEMREGPEKFPWVGLGLFKDEKYIITKGWGENGQCMLKLNLSNRSIGIIMTNKDPEVPQEESGIEAQIDFFV